MNFRFTLQALLLLRRREEEIETRQLAALIQECFGLRQRIDAAENLLQLSVRVGVESLAHGAWGVLLHAEDLAAQRQRESLVKWGQELSNAEAKLSEQQRNWQSAMQKRKTLERLRERREIEFNRVRARREQAQSEELFLIRRGVSPPG